MFVKYFIPEDGDEQAHPNVFRLDSTQPTFSEIKSAFPVAGTYHFRFLKNIGSHIVWLDVVDDGSALPTFQGSLFIKASRIANSSSAAAASTRHEFAPSLPTFHQPAEASPRASEPATVSPPVKAPKPPLVDKQKSEKLLKFDDDGTSSPRSSDFTASAPAPSTGAPLLPESDLLGISSTPETASHKSAASTDFFGLEALQPMSAPVSNNVMGGSQRSHSPMNPMTSGISTNPMGGGGPAMGMGGASVSNKGPMGGGPAMGMGGQNVMGGGRGNPNQGQGLQGGMGAPPRQMGGPGTPGYDPFNNIAGLNGIGQNPSGRGAGMNGRR